MLERASLAVLAGLGLFAAACSETKPSDVRVVTNVLVTGVAPVVGASMQYTATAVWSDGVQENVTTAATWQSSNQSILTVTAAGMVTGVGPGSANVTATYQSKTGSVALNVAAVACNFTVSPLEIQVPKTGGNATINVVMTGPACEWDAFTGHPFIHVLSGSTGIGNGTIAVSIDPNTELGRDGSVIVSHRFVVHVKQKQADCVTKLTPIPATLPAGTGFQNVAVTVSAPPGCLFTGTDASRLVQINNASGSGGGVIDLVIWVNGTDETRMNEITVEQLKVVVPQAPAQGSFFRFTSDAADRTGSGWDMLGQPPNHPITASTSSTNEARFTMTTPGPFFGGAQFSYNLTLRAPNGQPLVPGTYTNATGVDGSPSLPYLNLKYATDCHPTGSFTVHEAVFGPGPTVVRFFATFQQRCASSPTSVLRGQISYGR